jgi:glycerol kinase
VWDRRDGRAVYRAIVWQDRRTADVCQALKDDGLEPLFSERTGLLLDPYFSGTKVQWILDHVDGARTLAEDGHLAFGTIDSWILWNLTGGEVHATDATNASRTLMLDIRTGEWDPELLDILDVPGTMLPFVQGSSEVYGVTDKSLFGTAIPVAGMAGDQQAALFGQQCVNPGMAKCTYGTGCFVLQNTGTRVARSKEKLLTTIAWRLGNVTTYALEGSVFVGGAVVQWLRDGLGIIKRSSDIEALAASVDDNGGVYMVPAFTGLGAPHWDPHARGTIVGLTRGSSAAHVARAALESIAFQCYDVLDAMKADSEPLSEIRVDGGAAQNDTLMQFQADLLGVPVIRSATKEATAQGAAFFAGLATGMWSDPDELAGLWKSERVFRPRRDLSGLVTTWRRAVERARHWTDPTADAPDNRPPVGT